MLEGRRRNLRLGDLSDIQMKFDFQDGLPDQCSLFCGGLSTYGGFNVSACLPHQIERSRQLLH